MLMSNPSEAEHGISNAVQKAQTVPGDPLAGDASTMHIMPAGDGLSQQRCGRRMTRQNTYEMLRQLLMGDLAQQHQHAEAAHSTSPQPASASAATAAPAAAGSDGFGAEPGPWAGRRSSSLLHRARQAGTSQPALDLSSHALLRIETLYNRALKALVLVAFCAILVSAALLVAFLVLKLVSDGNLIFKHAHEVAAANLVVASVSMLTLVGTLALMLWRLFKRNAWKQLQWSSRRLHLVQLFLLELCVLLFANTAYFANNLYFWYNTYTDSCPSPFGRKVPQYFYLALWSAWNLIFVLSIAHVHALVPLEEVDEGSGVWGRALKAAVSWMAITRGWPQRVQRESPVLADLPLWTHAPKVLLWLLGFGISLAYVVLNIRIVDDLNSQYSPEELVILCETLVDCGPVTTNDLTKAVGAVNLTYLVLEYCIFALTTMYALQTLRKEPYNDFRFVNLILRYQIRIRTTSFAFVVLSILTMWFVKYDACDGVALVMLGYMPIQLISGIISPMAAMMHLPVVYGTDRLMLVLLQQPIWCEEDIPAMRQLISASPAANNETFLCFESVLKSFYMAYLAYGYQEAENSQYTPDFAMRLFGCTRFELLWDRAKDTKGVMVWGDKVAALAFRGTASTSNVLTDIKAWLTSYRVAGGADGQGHRMAVHRGFLEAWQANGYSDMVLGKVCEVIQSQGRGPFVLYVIGHSLGGALALLAAMDIAAACHDLCALDIRVITFGCPRVGNHAFAREVDARLPNTWNIVNNQDIIFKNGKLLWMFKHSRLRAVLQPSGDFVVRPAHAERHALNRRATVSDHLLTNYRTALVAVMRKQFVTRGLPGGREGLLRMLGDPTMSRLLVDTFEAQPDAVCPFPSRQELKEKERSAKAGRNGKSRGSVTAAWKGMGAVGGRQRGSEQEISKSLELPVLVGSPTLADDV